MGQLVYYQLNFLCNQIETTDSINHRDFFKYIKKKNYLN